MLGLVQVVVAVLAALLVIVTLLPFSGSHAWWVRIWDFPRVQIAVGLAAVLAASAVLPGLAGGIVAAAAAACLGWQLWRIGPFTPLARKEMRLAGGTDAADVTLLGVNVLMENAEHDQVAALIRREDPDVLLLMETDQVWCDALAPVLDGYPTVLRAPRDDHYGMVFATRLEAAEARIVRLTEDETPSVFARLATRDGHAFHFVGLHPQPPVPGVDTEERDTQILYAARFARAAEMPLVVMGDFNDAAWSDTAERFKAYGRYVDPRVGRGIYASFDANRWLIRCAIDQLYVTDDVAMVSFGLGPHVGSDHFPVIARVRIDARAAAALNRRAPPLAEEERADLDRRVTAWGRRIGAAAP